MKDHLKTLAIGLLIGMALGFAIKGSLSHEFIATCTEGMDTLQKQVEELRADYIVCEDFVEAVKAEGE